MQNSITAVINAADIQGKYLNTSDLAKLTHDFKISELRVEAASTISKNAAIIVKEAGAKFLLDSKANPSSRNLYNTRRYTACIRDLDYFLRYSTYAMLANDCSLLDERLLKGLKETYQSLGVSLQSTVEAVQVMKDVTASLLEPHVAQEIRFYFDYICDALEA